jgi:hypothetical protein
VWAYWSLAQRAAGRDGSDETSLVLQALLQKKITVGEPRSARKTAVGFSKRSQAFWIRPSRLMTDVELRSGVESPSLAFYASRPAGRAARVALSSFVDSRDFELWTRGLLDVANRLTPAQRDALVRIAGQHAQVSWPFNGVILLGHDSRTDRGVIWLGARSDVALARLTSSDQAAFLRTPADVIHREKYGGLGGSRAYVTPSAVKERFRTDLNGLGACAAAVMETMSFDEFLSFERQGDDVFIASGTDRALLLVCDAADEGDVRQALAPLVSSWLAQGAPHLILVSLLPFDIIAPALLRLLRPRHALSRQIGVIDVHELTDAICANLWVWSRFFPHHSVNVVLSEERTRLRELILGRDYWTRLVEDVPPPSAPDFASTLAATSSVHPALRSDDQMHLLGGYDLVEIVGVPGSGKSSAAYHLISTDVGREAVVVYRPASGSDNDLLRDVVYDLSFRRATTNTFVLVEDLDRDLRSYGESGLHVLAVLQERLAREGTVMNRYRGAQVTPRAHFTIIVTYASSESKEIRARFWPGLQKSSLRLDLDWPSKEWLLHLDTLAQGREVDFVAFDEPAEVGALRLESDDHATRSWSDVHADLERYWTDRIARLEFHALTLLRIICFLDYVRVWDYQRIRRIFLQATGVQTAMFSKAMGDLIDLRIVGRENDVLSIRRIVAQCLRSTLSNDPELSTWFAETFAVLLDSCAEPVEHFMSLASADELAQASDVAVPAEFSQALQALREQVEDAGPREKWIRQFAHWPQS